ncbi:RagB/SusD family nutrient uptake outer membrane protein [Echinicola jeungdonensis]|uniref:RagB/SusD family nutrient uptake outer membrane protein n=1 Tax=Echinicola jeungdonensis TaxID=709343 RepID=A0ABV5J8G1_9BACT|nr:RagB/SusD family nutrient uptake outer membrane protein [Echinicola jeungdonensis]MDN3669445.1 RagB/SusD family nutrient uptake outer membrane protein [Echinicola jeungdonensis]
MKKMILKFSRKLTLALIVVMGFLGGCSLDEEVYSIYTPENFYSNEKEVLSSLSGVYRNFAQITGMGVEYRTLELSADQVVVHGKIQGWWANSSFEQLMEHEWDASHSYISGTWNTMFGTVGQANALIASLDASGLENIEGPRAELKALRAFAYFYLIDLFGNVPIFTAPKVDPLNLPTQNTRVEVFDFIEKELEEALVDLPSQTEVGAEYYGRFTKEAAYTLMAHLYLNAEVFTGTAQYDKAVEYADKVIQSGAYELLPNYFDNFKHDNENNSEYIFGGVYTPNIPGGIGHPLVQKVLPGISGGLFGLPYTPQNGFGTRPSVVDLYEEQDDRFNMYLTPGVLKDPRNGETVMVERIVPDNNSQLYKPGVSSEGPVPYEIIPATGIRNQPMNAGTKWIKWGLDPNTNGGNAGNDIAFFRYADVLLIKAEGLARMGNFGEATDLVNLVRDRSNASLLSTVTLQDILDERGRELAFELCRRRDLIRFGQFNDPWEFKEASEDYRTLYPIPSTAIDANPNLSQNEGYQ